MKENINNKKIVISVTCYDNADEVIEFAKHLSVQEHSEKIVLLVTVNRLSNSLSLHNGLKNIKLSSHIYYPESNLGYLNGCLYGLYSYRKWEDSDWIVISNTDIAFKDSSCIKDLLDTKYSRDVWVLAPNIVLPDGRHQNPFLIEKPKRKKVIYWRIIQEREMALKIYTALSRMKKAIVHNKSFVGDREIYAAHGSFLILRPECISAIPTDNKIFMYGEELLIGEIACKNTKTIKYIDHFIVRHNENSTTGRIDYAKKAMWYSQSYKYLLDNYFRDV